MGEVLAVRVPGWLARSATLASVVGLWVIFRAPSWQVAAKLLTAMAVGTVPDTRRALAYDALLYIVGFGLIVILGIIALTMPNSRQLARRFRQGRLISTAGVGAVPIDRLLWVPAAVAGIALYVAIASIGSVPAKFIYFNF